MSGELEDPRALVARCVAGDHDAWERLARDHAETMSRRVVHVYCSRLGRRPGALETEECVQEAFVRLAAGGARLLEAFRWRSSLPTFLGAVAAIAARDRIARELRRAGRVSLRLDLLDPDRHPAVPGPDPLGQLEAAETERLVERLVLDLPERERLVVRLRFQEGMEAGDIARILAVSPAYARTILSRAVEKLREKLKKA